MRDYFYDLINNKSSKYLIGITTKNGRQLYFDEENYETLLTNNINRATLLNDRRLKIMVNEIREHLMTDMWGDIMKDADAIKLGPLDEVSMPAFKISKYLTIQCEECGSQIINFIDLNSRVCKCRVCGANIYHEKYLDKFDDGNK